MIGLNTGGSEQTPTREDISPSSLILLESELKTIISAIESQLESERQARNTSRAQALQKEIEAVQNTLAEIKQKQFNPTTKEIEDKIQEVSEASEEASKFMRLREIAKSVGRGEQSLETFKQHAEEYLTSLPEIKNLPEKDRHSRVEKMVNSDLIDNRIKGPKPNIWQRFIIRVNLLLGKDIKWVHKYLTNNVKSFNADGKKAFEYLVKAYPDLKTDSIEYKALEEKYNPLQRAITPTIEDNKPITGKKDESKPENSSREIGDKEPQNTTARKKLEEIKGILSPTEQTPERKTEIQSRMNEIVEYAKNVEQALPIESRVRNATKRVLDVLVSENVALSEGQINSMFDSFIALNDNQELPERLQQEIQVAKGTLIDYQKDKERQGAILLKWYSVAEGKASSETNPEKRAEIIQREFARFFIDSIVKDQDTNGIFKDRKEFTKEQTQKLLMEAIESGQLELSTFDGMPVLLINSLKGKESKGGLTNQQLMLLIGAARESDILDKKSEGNSPLGLFVKTKNADPSLIVLDRSQIEGDGSKGEFEVDKILHHELMHARNEIKRDAVRNWFINRQNEATLRGKWVDKLVRDVISEKQIESLPISEDKKQEYMELAESNPEEFKERIMEQISLFVSGREIGESEKGELYSLVEKNPTAIRLKKFNENLFSDSYGSKFEELLTYSIDSQLPLSLSHLGFKNGEFDPNNSEHQALLGLLRLTNGFIGLEATTDDPNDKSQIYTSKLIVLQFLAGTFNNPMKPSNSELIELLRKAHSNKDHFLHEHLKILFGEESFEHILSIISQAPNDYEIPSNSVENKNRMYKASHSDSFLRNAVTMQTRALWFDRKGVSNRMGGRGLGTKLDIMNPIGGKHQKERGPLIFTLIHPALTRKIFVDGFGMGINKFRIDSNDGLEALAFLTGIPLHRIPALQNLPEWLKKKTGERINLDRKVWTPDGLLFGSPDAYIYHTLNTIYGRLGSDHIIDGESLLKLLPELGGYVSNRQGTPEKNMSGYITHPDQFRLNDQLADFVDSDLIRGKSERLARIGPNGLLMRDPGDRNSADMETVTRDDDLGRIRDRLRKDEIIFNGVRTTIYSRLGMVVTEALKDRIETDHLSIEDINRDPALRAMVVQKGSLSLGQLSYNVLQEIKEIMFIPPNTDPRTQRIRNPFGLAAQARDRSLKPSDALLRIEKYEKIAEYIMQEDDRRRRAGEGQYTMKEFADEMYRAQRQSLVTGANGDSTLFDPEVEERLTNPKMQIGGHIVDLLDCKEFFKDFDMARSYKVLAVGVWGREADYDEMDNSDYLAPILAGLPRNPNGFIDQNQLIPGILSNGYVEVDLETELPDGINGRYFSKLVNRNTEYYILEMTPQGTPTLRKVKSLDFRYNKDKELEIENPMTGYRIRIPPIKNLSRGKLRDYFGELSKHKVYYQPKTPGAALAEKTVECRAYYDTGYGVMYDDVIDEMDKIYKGRKLSYQYSLKLAQLDAYREYSKIKKEFWDGLLSLEKSSRFFILASALLGVMSPGLAFLINPQLIFATILSALTVNPFFSRYQQGYAARELAAIEKGNEVRSMAGQFWELANENTPPSYGALDLATATFEGIKYSHLSILKSFGQAKWDSNMFTGLFKQAWDKVSEKPF